MGIDNSCWFSVWPWVVGREEWEVIMEIACHFETGEWFSFSLAIINGEGVYIVKVVKVRRHVIKGRKESFLSPGFFLRILLAPSCDIRCTPINPRLIYSTHIESKSRAEREREEKASQPYCWYWMLFWWTVREATNFWCFLSFYYMEG